MRVDYPYPVPDPPPGGWMWYTASPESITIHRKGCRHVDDQHPITHPPVVALTTDAAIIEWCTDPERPYRFWTPCTQCIDVFDDSAQLW